MKREKLKECLIHLGCSFYKGYLADEADKVMDAYEARIKELESDNERLKAIVDDEEYKQGLSGLAQRNAELRDENDRLKAANFDLQSHFDTLKEDYEELKAQVPKWHDLTKPLYTEDGVNYYDLPAEHGEYIVDCGGKECTYSEYDPDYNDWCELVSTAKVTRWCEFPATEESSATEKDG